MLKKEIPAPFRPEIKSNVDLSNFDQKFVKLDLAESLVPDIGLEKIKQQEDAFKNFGFEASPD